MSENIRELSNIRFPRQEKSQELRTGLHGGLVFIFQSIKMFTEKLDALSGIMVLVLRQAPLPDDIVKFGVD